jgi:predicted alpha/beta superfamily hydrolase
MGTTRSRQSVLAPPPPKGQGASGGADQPQAERPVRWRIRSASLLTGIWASAMWVAAQQPTLPAATVSQEMKSAKLGEMRQFWVSLPDGYGATGEPYPVLYMMDGDFNFNSGGIGGLRYAASLGEIPEFIIVGIKNTDRSKDAFPEEVTYSDGSKGGGRADRYLDFIQTELIPYIDRTYRTQTYRVLYGTSNTGFTAVHALLHRPELASAYIAASATLSVRGYLAERDERIRTFAGGRRQLVLVMGEQDLPTVLVQNSALKERVEALAATGLTCRLTVIEGAGHVPAASLVTGVRCLFEGWSLGQPLTAQSFQEIRDKVQGRLARYGVAEKLPESALQSLGDTLLEAKKTAEALAVCRYRAESYPRSAEAQVGLGDAYRQGGQPEKARACYRQALVLAPDHPTAGIRLRETGT